MSMLSPLNDNNSSHIRLENKWTIAKSYSKQTINNLSSVSSKKLEMFHNRKASQYERTVPSILRNMEANGKNKIPFNTQYSSPVSPLTIMTETS